MTWTRQPIQLAMVPVPGSDVPAWRPITAYVRDDAPGLAVHAQAVISYGRPSGVALGTHYAVTHVPSGRALVKWLPRLVDAALALEELAALGNWERSAEAIIADRNFSYWACEAINAIWMFADVPLRYDAEAFVRGARVVVFGEDVARTAAAQGGGR